LIGPFTDRPRQATSRDGSHQFVLADPPPGLPGPLAEGATGMGNFEKISAMQFAAAIGEGPASPSFYEQYARFLPAIAKNDEGYMLHRGSLSVPGDFTTPALCTLIIGDLNVEGLVSLENPGYDEGGLFVVLGSVHCKAFRGHYGKCSFVDGDLEADDLIVNAYEDSTLVVIGSLKTFYFLGRDVWAEVGAGAVMTYGQGFCLPIGYTEAPEQVIEAQHDEAMSEDLIGGDDDEEPADVAAVWAAVRRARRSADRS
jgi:hypothetical protein